MTNTLLDYFRLQRQIFCLCPKCYSILRLSDLNIYIRSKPIKDWLDKIEEEENKLEIAQQRIEDKRQEYLNKARFVGRKQAEETVRKVDKVFYPMKMNADDAKVIFHPIDYIVFHGMKNKPEIEKIVILDHKRENAIQQKIQKSIKKAVNKGNYEWQTLRVDESGLLSVDEKHG